MKLFLRSGIVIVLIMLAVARQLCAQQNILFNTWQYDPMQLNIAYAAQECVEANLNYRNQWMGLKGAPTLYQLNAHTPLPKNTGLGCLIPFKPAPDMAIS